MMHAAVLPPDPSVLSFCHYIISRAATLCFHSLCRQPLFPFLADFILQLLITLKSPASSPASSPPSSAPPPLPSSQSHFLVQEMERRLIFRLSFFSLATLCAALLPVNHVPPHHSLFGNTLTGLIMFAASFPTHLPPGSPVSDTQV